MVDIYGKERRAGDEWLIGISNAESHILDVNEELVKTVNITSLSNRQYCYILNPLVEGVRKFGERLLVKGEKKFFVQPGEILENNKIYDVQVLGEEEALLLKAIKSFTDDTGKEVIAGTVWIHPGPCDFIPRLEVTVLETRRSFPLDKNEGIYVRNKRSGEVALMKGSDQ